MASHRDFPLALSPSPPYSASSLIPSPVNFRSLAKLPNLDSSAHVSFYRPAYSTLKPNLPSSTIGSDAYSQDAAALMFRLPAYDNGGVHYWATIYVCIIVTWNESGYIRKDSPSQRCMG